MTVEQLRHYARYAVNGITLALAILALPALGAVVPVSWLPAIAQVAAVLNTILSLARRVA